MDGGTERNAICRPFSGWNLALEVLILAQPDLLHQEIIDTIVFDNIELAIFASALYFLVGVAWNKLSVWVSTF